ncbi:HNH endonuclease [Nocardiopsis sp. YSL2]|uniref:HNH endonuclease n=1 Tax=Nocardiopsis sp. YSL2 TaxID=2939492 RepID=UPI0026F453B4|nr:HNH endonuclease signature motif containing protein [Nocardiopsis sp. YSL2]
MTKDEGRPDWNDRALGGRVRVALWLYEMVGEGKRFRKQAMREAIPGVEQVDRRMRDLRSAGWVIRTYRDMASLSPDELFLETIGAHVWEPGKRSTGLRTVSGKLRREVMDRDHHRCVRCGISSGEEYPDEPGSRARLTLGHINAHAYGSGATPENLVTECSRCNETAKQFTPVQFTADHVRDQMRELSKREKTSLLSWMALDQRPMSKAERVWAYYRQLPGSARDELHTELARMLGSERED